VAVTPGPALELLDVFRIYRSGPVETVALRGLTLEIPQGAFVAVLGPSGSGKSTFLHLAAGLDQPSAGTVRAGGRSLGELDEKGLSEHRARGSALVFQRDNLWPQLGARANVELTLRLAGAADVRARADEALAAVGLAARADHRAAELSGGEQQRVAIAAAAARRAPLVLADEPTGELDRSSESAVIAALERVRELHGSTLILVTHSSRLAERADSVITVRDGQVAA
jgi:putative ABC transport system ATP-binding protein